MTRRANRRARPRRRGRRRRPRRLARALTVASLLLVASGVVAVAWLLIVYPTRPATGQGRDILLELPDGLGVEELAARLGEAGVVDDPWLFAAYLRILGLEDELRDGPVTVNDTMSPAELVRQVSVGVGRVRVRVTIPEGWTRFQIAERLERLRVCDAEDFLAQTEDPQLLAANDIEGESAEGYLFPDTYQMREGLDARGVVDRLLRNFRRRVMPVVDEHAEGFGVLRRELGWDLHDVLTMASIVEKEAAAADERPIIAGVFLNRLRSEEFRPKRLQADPTVMYGCLAIPGASAACAAFDGRDITRDMLRDGDNPYNTYRHEGLPPGPIANPGVDSIRAVLAPADHDYLYFVASGGGRHRFSATLEEHNAAVRRHLGGSE